MKLKQIVVSIENATGRLFEVTSALGNAGINLRGLSAAVIGARFVLYIGLDSEADADKAVGILQQA